MTEIRACYQLIILHFLSPHIHQQPGGWKQWPFPCLWENLLCPGQPSCLTAPGWYQELQVGFYCLNVAMWCHLRCLSCLWVSHQPHKSELFLYG